MGAPELFETMSIDLNDSERQRGLAIFTMMDADEGGTVDIDEICIVHDSDRDAMLKILDNNGDGEVSSEEWLGYLDIKKKEKGKKKFGYFLNYLEQEVPKNLDKITAKRADSKAAAEAPAGGGSPKAAASGNRVLKEEFAKAVEVFEPPNLGLKDTRIKDAFTNLMFAIQDLDAAVGQGTQ